MTYKSYSFLKTLGTYLNSETVSQLKKLFSSLESKRYSCLAGLRKGWKQ